MVNIDDKWIIFEKEDSMSKATGMGVFKETVNPKE
jgi:hypothetical protein